MPLLVSLWNDRADPVFDGVGLAETMLFYWPKLLHPYFFYYFSLSLLPFYMLVLWGWGLRIDGVYITLTQPCAADHFY